MAGAAGSAVLGVATSWTCVGGVAGGVGFVYSADVAATGFRQIMSGKSESNTTHKAINGGLQAAGLPEVSAQRSATFAEFGLGFATAGGGFTNVLKVPKAVPKVARVMVPAEEAVAAKVGTNVFRSFTSSNFRNNLGKLTGNIPANSQAHHVFPQAKRFSDFFNSRGINIHDPKFGSWWETVSHGKNAYQYNAKWTQWITNNPNATINDVMDFGRQIMSEYGLRVNY